MKKKNLIVAILCLVTLLSFCSKSYAESYTIGVMSLGNSITIEKLENTKCPFLFTTEFRLGQDLDWSAQRNISLAEKISYTGLKIDDIELRPFVKLGKNRFYSKTQENGYNYDLRSDPNSFYEVGLESILKKWETVNLFAGAAYSNSFYRYSQYYADDTDYYDGDNRNVKTYNLYFGLSKKIEFINKKTLTPYVGINLIHLESIYRCHSEKDYKEKEDGVMGFTGLNYQIFKNATIGLELGYWDRDASATVSMTLQF